MPQLTQPPLTDEQILRNKYTALRECIHLSLSTFFSTIGDQIPENFELYNIFLQKIEFELLERVMIYCNGDQKKAANYLGISRGILRKRLKILHM